MTTPLLSPDRFADVLLEQTPREARAAALSLVDRGVRPRSIYLEVLGPALGEVGARWQRGTATIAQEHLATAVVSSIMATLATTLEEPPPISRRIVLACTEGGLHEVGLRMVGDFLEADGWEVFYLGALTPVGDLRRLVDDTRPDVVGLSTTLTTHLPAAVASIAALREGRSPPFVIVGGRAYGGDPEIARQVGADAFAADAGSASQFLRESFGRAAQPSGSNG
jgi:methanogenic corrinoid protein MtbC1